MCYLRAMIACHTRRFLTVCLFLGLLLHSTPDVVQLCVNSKVLDIMLRPTLSNHVCCPWAMISSICVCSPTTVMSLHAWLYLTMYVIQGLGWNATPDVVLPCLLSKGHNCIPCLTVSECVFYPKTMMTCHVRHCLTVRAVQGP